MNRKALREICGAAARVWVLLGAKPMKEYIYVDHRWVMLTLQYNGEEAAPRRRAGEKESDFLAPGPERTPTDRELHE